MRNHGLPVRGGPRGLWRNQPSQGQRQILQIERNNLLLSTCSVQSPVLGAGEQKIMSEAS